MKTRADLHREIAAVYDMIEGTKIPIWHCFKCSGQKYVINIAFDATPDLYEPCLAIVEGKPVFKGDKLWNIHHNDLISVGSAFRKELACNYSWNPPKPDTVMVELLREDAVKMAEAASERLAADYAYDRVGLACKKALEAS